MSSKYKSPLHETVSTTKTDFWNDSCSVKELTYAIEHGAVGATTNPVIVYNVVKAEMDLWKKRIYEIIDENPTWTETEVTWKLIEEVAVNGANLLKPVFDREKGLKGRLSIQTNPLYYRNAEEITRQAIYFDSLALNMQVKIPVTKAGIQAIEDATYHGVNINATVSFTVPQSLAVAEAVERGLKRREAEGKDVSGMTPVCTIMVGRIEDWVRVLVNRDKVITNPSYLPWVGVATFKHAYQLYNERGYRTRLLAAAYRHHLFWSEFIGGDVILTIPYGWQVQFNASDVEVKERMNRPVDPNIIEELRKKFPDFRRAYDADGMSVDEFDAFGATVRTLRGFMSGYYELVALVRDFMLPNPDV